MTDEHEFTAPGSHDRGSSPGGHAPLSPATLPPDDALTHATTDRALPATRPSAAYVPVRRWVLEEAHQLRGLRSDLREQLAASVVPSSGGESSRDDVVLVTSELATNALAHGRAPAQVQLLLDGQDVLVVVSDGDATHAPSLAADREPGEGGFGLQIARRLSSDVGWWADASGKHVWATFAAQPAT
ncbi:ATP-binding protein [Cellulomonas dongxiuzhuiae]|uniref:ATP-binding protein n=1 Tax=Cellulomonas dongxiuzhuiae TaxID=2819979 RepID=A0ABX8GJQ4_9CELL|nr:ATP-binding protein [Cellulomonas dongxiuzhuiae]MBO3089287.1 ATP-binding protein [Cellulomonas dongxiuzhuiae]MBO3094928.1 ATP-binding protein [Cellulomonas dongxiuzhuiae]QWC15952.1 ATP-binding protein [Cellulomonas dongxiuzhuiae]